MPSKDPIRRFEDILENILLIEEFTAGMDSTAFTEDLRTSNAAERCLERISEAAKKLGAVAEELCPAIPWPQLRAMGNLLRHEYDRIDIVRVWLTIEDDLPPLKAAVEAALKQLRESER
ncbi:MAG: DUF86 domain-containing protein [Bryobacteraceae bacterium]